MPFEKSYGIADRKEEIPTKLFDGNFGNHGACQEEDAGKTDDPYPHGNFSYLFESCVTERKDGQKSVFVPKVLCGGPTHSKKTEIH